MFDNTEIEEAIEELRSFWFDLSKFIPFKLWKGGFIYGFFFEKGLYDMEPMNEFLEEKFKGRELKQHVNLAVTNVLTGAFTSFDERHSPDELI